MSRPRIQREHNTEHSTYVAEEDENPPEGIENARNYSEDLDKGIEVAEFELPADSLPQMTKSFQELKAQEILDRVADRLLKQYPDIGAGIGVREGQSVKPATQGGQYLPQKPDEETTTIGDGNR